MREKTLLRGILDYYSTKTYTEITTHITKSIRIMHIEMYDNTQQGLNHTRHRDRQFKGNGVNKFD